MKQTLILGNIITMAEKRNYPKEVLGGVTSPRNMKEAITREQALQALTINCAKQMFIEKERGSVSVGKYADFLLVNKDVLSCPVTEIHEAKPAATYFEGKKVFSM